MRVPHYSPHSLGRMNIKNLNVTLATSTALLGLIIGFQGNNLLKVLGACALAGTTGYGASTLITKGKKHDRLYEAEKLVSVLRTDKIRLNNEAKTLQTKSDDFYQTIQALNSDAIALTEERDLLATRLQTAVGQVAIVQNGYQVIEATLEALKAEKQQLVEELDETLEDLRFAQSDRDDLVTQQVSEQTAVIHEDYKARLMSNVEKLANGKFNALSKNLLGRVESISAENENLRKEIDRYETEFGEIKTALSEEVDPFDFDSFMGEQTAAYQIRITELSTQISMLESQLLQATLPQKFPSGRDYEPGNKIIDWVWQSRNIPVDGVWRSVAGTNETFYFQLRSTKDIKPVQQCINSSLEDLRIATAVKQIGSMEWDTEKALLKLSVTNHVQIIDRNAIEKLWVPAHKFASLVGKWNRIRITGASEGAKSPLARNILGAKLMNGEQFDLVRFDPSGGSQKDYWRLAADSNDFTDLPEILNQMKEDVFSQARKADKNQLPRFYVIDETDSCFGRVKNPDDMATALKELGKHGSHTKVGCILCGQNANVTNYKNFQRSDFNSYVNIHIGANIMDALTNSNDASKVTELIQNARILLDYCNKENEGVETVNWLQVALVEEKGKRYFIQLPKLGEYGFDKQFPGSEYDFESGFSTSDYEPGLKSLNRALLIGKSQKTPGDTPQNRPQQNAENLNVSLPCKPPSPHPQRCPHCSSDKLVSKGSDRFACKSCKKSFAKSKALGGKS